MPRIRQGVATEAYWASTVRERPTPGRITLPGVPLTADIMFLDRHVGHNSAGADAAALECNRIYELKHQGRMTAQAALTTRPDLMHAVQAWM